MRAPGSNILTAMAALLLLVACGETKKVEPVVMSVNDTLSQAVEVKSDSTDTVAVPKIDTALFPLSNEILLLLKAKNYTALAEHVHPKKGVLFAPYSFIDVKHDRIFTARQLKSVDAQKKYKWGSYDGSGEPINLNMGDYFDRFVYNANFSDSAQMAQNDFLGKGNTINNLKEVYSGCNFVEYYFAGKDPKAEGLDWSSLRLVFKTENDQVYLVAVVHDQWTI